MFAISDESELALQYDTVIPVPLVEKHMTPSISTAERESTDEATDKAKDKTKDKATLYCPGCGHDSPITGDWTIHVLADSLTYECPNCQMVIDSRRNQTELVTSSPP